MVVVCRLRNLGARFHGWLGKEVFPIFVGNIFVDWFVLFELSGWDFMINV